MTRFIRSKSRLPHYLTIAIILLMGVAGIVLIGNGLWIKAKAELAQVLLNRAFERAQAATAARPLQMASLAGFKPWRWADIEPIARLAAPRLNKTAIILNNVSGEALAFGPGHLGNTPLPGENGTSVLAAHRDTHFSWIGKLKSGDRLEVERIDGRHVNFRVKRSWIARYDHSGINADSEGWFLALSTCYPFDAKTRGPMRYIVEAEMESPNLVTLRATRR